MSLIQLLFRQQIPMVRELVCIAGAGGIILVLRAGLTGRVEELHELSEAVGNLNRGLISQLLRNDAEGVRLRSLLLAHGKNHSVCFPVIWAG